MMPEPIALLPQFTGPTANLVRRIRQTADGVGIVVSIEHEDDYSGTSDAVIVDGYLHVEPTKKNIEVGFQRIKKEVDAWYVGRGVVLPGDRWTPDDYDVQDIGIEIDDWAVARLIILTLCQDRIAAAQEYHSEREMEAQEVWA